MSAELYIKIIQTNKETSKYAELLPSFPLQCQFHPKITSWTKCSWRALSNRNSHVSIHAQLSLTTIHLMYTFTTDFIIITTNNHLSIYFFNPTSLVLLHLVSDQSLSVEGAQIICLYIRNLKVIDDQRKLSQLSRNIEPWCTTGGSEKTEKNHHSDVSIYQPEAKHWTLLFS